MKNKYLLLAIVIFFQFCWVIKLNYPPSFEQITFPLTASWQLWLLRFVTLSLVVFTLFEVSRFLSAQAKVWFWILASLSPVPILLVQSYPISVLKLTIVILIIKNTGRRTISKISGLILIIFLLALVNIKLLGQTPAIVHRFSLPDIQAELTDRFNKEYLLQPGNYIPLGVKRLAYNKPFFLIKNVANEVSHYADLETLFFQEVHPVNQKSEPIFFWGELGLFALAIWLLASKKILLNYHEYLLLIVSVIYFVMTDDIVLLRYLISFLFIVVLMAEAIPILISDNYTIKVFTYLFILLALYGGLAHFIDHLKRPDYWLDNKPLVYKIYFESVPTDSYSKVHIADLFGQAPRYCHFYRSDCQKFIFDNFQISNLITNENDLYIGFSGNFFGVDLTKNFDDLPRADLIYSQSIRDNIANGYGQKIIFAGRSPL